MNGPCNMWVIKYSANPLADTMHKKRTNNINVLITVGVQPMEYTIVLNVVCSIK